MPSQHVDPPSMVFDSRIRLKIHPQILFDQLSLNRLARPSPAR